MHPEKDNSGGTGQGSKDFSVIPEPADEISGQDRESVLHACYGDLGL